MQSSLKIYIDRLTGEKTEIIEEMLSSDFMEFNEKDLQFCAPICLRGKTYLAQDFLILHLSIQTEICMPCSICNEKAKKKINIPTFYHTEELVNIPSQVYDYATPLREAILLEIPSYLQCLENCPKQSELSNYLTQGVDQFPFKDLS